MDLITLDFETYYDRDFSLTKLTTEEYIRDPRFEVIGLGVKVNGGEIEWASGPHEKLKAWLQQFDWANSMVLAHNAMFDGAILSWHFGIRPLLWLDTLCMGRALYGVEVSGSLAALAEREDVGRKGTEVLNVLGMHRADFTAERLARYGDYCLNDVELTYRLFQKLMPRFPKKELKVIDTTIRMFTEPALTLDTDMLQAHLAEVKDKKDKILTESGFAVEDLMSNHKFAAALRSLGVEPPMKLSPTTNKPTLAMAKNDEEFLKLTEHEDWRVQAMVTARLGVKSTLEETRTQRFIDIASRGALPVPIKYYAAHTGRFGGDDKINLQNLPSRGANANKLKLSICAPAGYTIIDADSSQIEARVLAWLAGQDDLVQAFANKEDVYKKMASAIYGRGEDNITKSERFVGKTTILGAGYGMGAVKFQAQLQGMGTTVALDEARRIVDIYRKSNPAITALWRQAQVMLVSMSRRESSPLGVPNVLGVVPNESAVLLPSGLLLRYDDIKAQEGEKGIEFTYKTRKGRTRIYGGKVIENVCQAIARCIIGEQMLRVAKRYKVVLTVHDAVACVVPDDRVTEAVAFVDECMRWVPKWATGLPLACEVGYGKRYGDCG
jgi:DNA polymerase